MRTESKSGFIVGRIAVHVVVKCPYVAALVHRAIKWRDEVVATIAVAVREAACQKKISSARK